MCSSSHAVSGKTAPWSRSQTEGWCRDHLYPFLTGIHLPICTNPLCASSPHRDDETSTPATTFKYLRLIFNTTFKAEHQMLAQPTHIKAPCTEKNDGVDKALFFGCDYEYLHPKRSALPHGGELCRLVVSEPEGGQGAVLGSKGLHHAQKLHELAPEQEEGVADLNNVSVVSDVARRRSQVDDRHGLAAQQAE